MTENFSILCLRPLQRTSVCVSFCMMKVYVKQMLLYHGGSVFGRAADDTSSLAKTMLGIKIVCLLGGPSFLIKMIPVAKLNSKFLYKQLQNTEENIEKARGSVKAIISDGNRVNSTCFQKYATLPEKPWVTDAVVFLLLTLFIFWKAFATYG